MKLFGFNISRDSAPESPSTGKWAFSTPFLKVGKNNLSLPYINRWYTLQGIVQFGEDNLYPQILNQLYYTSPIHSQCIDFITNTIIGGGYEWDEVATPQEKVEIKTFERVNRFKKLSRLLTRDWVIHRRITVVVKRINDKTFKLIRLDPSSIRNNPGAGEYVYSSDWSRGMLETKTYKKWHEGCKLEESLYVYEDNTPGADIYPIPGYTSALNWAFLDGEISYFHKNNLQNSIFPSIVIRRPKDFSTIEEIEQFKAMITDQKGASAAGKVLVLTGNGKDDMPEFQSVSVNQNDKLFEVVATQTRENIAMAHGLNPAIIGIKTEGSLGNSQELKMAYTIFEKNVVMPMRDIVDEFLNDLIAIGGVKSNITINDFQIVDDEIVDATK